MILARQVTVDGQVASKAGASTAADARVELVAPDHPYVGRGGVKLAHALEVFGILVPGRLALDIGASTGGFTDVLLQRGAASVVALDVGHGQLDWRLRNDPRVIVREGVNARALTDRDVPHRVDLVTIDVAFISLKHIFPAFLPFLNEPCDIVALVKPQFEAGRAEVERGGVVRSESARRDALVSVGRRATEEWGMSVLGYASSALPGPAGNLESFIWIAEAGREGGTQDLETAARKAEP